MRTGRMKRGFTLIETVVTVGIVAAMAAVVIPQVAKQFDAADPTRVQNDLKNIQTAIETFFVNVKTMPGDIDDLANLIDGGGNTDTSLTVAISALPIFTSSQDELWNGPYVDQSITQSDPDDEITTGYGAKMALAKRRVLVLPMIWDVPWRVQLASFWRFRLLESPATPMLVRPLWQSTKCSMARTKQLQT
jgi:prepilin-type N-terminal cleavage/methylation domain-containing protein